MPVLFNSDSGLAENFPDQASAQQALDAGTHEVPLVSPGGDIGSASHEEAQRLSQDGYSQPSPDQLQGLLDKAKYSSTGQQLIGGAEQVAQGVAGPLATATEVAAGVPKKDILGRAEAKGTGEKMIEQGAGLVGSMFLPFGQGKALAKAGELGAEAFGIGKGASTLSKIGSAGAKAAIENAVYQSGDETSKAILGDPNQTASSVMANIGLATALGGGTGAALGTVSPLWTATVGPRTENLMRTIANRANEETLPISQDLGSVIDSMEKSGRAVPPEIRAGLSDSPLASNYFQELRESGTTTGDALRETIEKFKGDVGDQIQGIFREQGSVSPFEAGEKAKEDILKAAGDLSEANTARYQELAPHLESTMIPDETRLKFADQMVRGAQDAVGTDSPYYELYKHYSERVLARDNVAQLKSLNTEIGSEASVAKRAGNFEKYRALSDIRNQIKNFQKDAFIETGKRLEAEGNVGMSGIAQKLVEDREVADKKFGEFMDTLGDIGSVAKLGKVRSMSGLEEALERTPSAKLADKLFDPKNIEGLRYLKENFPDVFNSIAQAKKTSLIDSATSKGELMHNQLLNAVNKIPKEARELMFSGEELGAINAGGRILRESTKRMNPSGTAATMDKIMQNLPSGVAGVASVLLGKNPLVGMVLGHAAKFISRDVPDAAKMALLKFLGSPEITDASSLKAAGDYIQKAMRAKKMIESGANAIFKSGQEVMPKSMVPDQKSRDKLEKRLDEIQKNPSSMLDIGGKIGHYMPDHAQAIGGIAAQAVQYLNELKPKVIQNSPLDTPFELPQQREKYNTALDVAQAPLLVLQKIKSGELVPDQIEALKVLYPPLYDKFKMQIMEAMTNHMAAGGSVPYATRTMLSLFMGESLDSTTSQESILAAQMAQSRSQAREAQKQGANQKAAKQMEKVTQSYQTASQAREAQKLSGKS